MILVDTSVWIDFFAGRDLPHVSLLEQCILSGENLALCGIILTEILQGIADDASYDEVRRRLRPLVWLPITEPVFVQAAEIYRGLRKQGITIRKSNDCIIAATAMTHRCRLLHNDCDFSAIARHFPLATLPARS